MSLMLPPNSEGLVNALLVITAGDLFPKADEDALRALADQARVFANALGTEIGGLDSLVVSVLNGLDTNAGRAFARYGHKLDEFGAGLTDQAQQVGTLLDEFALSVENAKYQMIIGATITAAMIAWGFATPWGAALVAPYTTSLRNFIAKVWSRYTNTLQLILKGALTEAAQETASAFLSQLIQVWEGNRKTYDGKDIGYAAGFGAGAGFFAPIASGILRVGDNVLRGHRDLLDNWKHFANIHTPTHHPSVATHLAHETLTEGITELVISAATLPLGGAINGLGFSVASGIFSGFSEGASHLIGQQVYDKHLQNQQLHNTPPPDHPPNPNVPNPTDPTRSADPNNPNTISSGGDPLPPTSIGIAAMSDPGPGGPTPGTGIPSYAGQGPAYVVDHNPPSAPNSAPSLASTIDFGPPGTPPPPNSTIQGDDPANPNSATAGQPPAPSGTGTSQSTIPKPTASEALSNPASSGNTEFDTANSPGKTAPSIAPSIVGNATEASFVTANPPPPSASNPTSAPSTSSPGPSDYHDARAEVDADRDPKAQQQNVNPTAANDPHGRVRDWLAQVNTAQQQASPSNTIRGSDTAPSPSSTSPTPSERVQRWRVETSDESSIATPPDLLSSTQGTGDPGADPQERSVRYRTESSSPGPEKESPSVPTDQESWHTASAKDGRVLEKGFVHIRAPKEPGVPKVVVHKTRPTPSADEELPKKPKSADNKPAAKKPAGEPKAPPRSPTETEESFDPSDSDLSRIVPIRPPKQTVVRKGWPTVPPAPAPDSTTVLPPSNMIVSVGVPKGRLPNPRALIRGLQDRFPQLANTPNSTWNDFGREVLSKFRQIAYDRGRRIGDDPPLSHPFDIGGVSVLISLELAFDQLVPDPSGERDGLPYNHPLRRKRGKVSGVETVNSKYNLGTTNKTLAGSTAYTQLNGGPSRAFPQEIWTPGFTFSFELEMNRNNRSITSVKDAEFGNVENSRTDVVYLAYRPTWVARVMNLDGTYTPIPVTPPNNASPERVVLAVANPYVQPAPGNRWANRGIPPARIEEVPDDQQPNTNWQVIVPYTQARIARPNKDFAPLPDHYLASGLTNLDQMYQNAITLLTEEGFQNFDRASIKTKLWNLETNLHFAADPTNPHGYQFPVFDDKARMVALIQVHTTLFPNGFTGVERIGVVSDKVHIEDVATAIDGYAGGHSIAHSLAVNPGFPTTWPLPGTSVGITAALAGQVKSGNSNGISTSRVSLWVHVARFVGRTGAHSIPMVHTVRVINPNSVTPSRTRETPSRALIRTPEREASRRWWPLEPNSPFRYLSTEIQGRPGSEKDFTTGVGMGLVRVSDVTVREIHDFITSHLGREGFLHTGEHQLDRARLDSIRTHQQLANAIALDKLVSQAALRTNYDMIHQDGYTFTLEIPSDMPAPTVPAGRMRYARITIQAQPTMVNGKQRQNFKGTTKDFHTVNLAMGMSTVGQSVGGSASVKVGAKAGMSKGLLQNLTLAGLSFSYNRGTNNETKLLNNRPELLEYSHEVEEWEVYSDYMIHIVYQDAPVLSSTLPPPEPINRPRYLPNQAARVHTLDFINGLDQNVPVMPNRKTRLAKLPDRFLDNAVVYKVDTTGIRPELLEMLGPFSGPAGYADQELSSMAGTTNLRAWVKELIRDKVSTDLPFKPGWRKDLHGSASIKANILGFDFQGATKESFTLGIIKLGLISTSMNKSDTLTLFPELLNNVTVGAPVGGPADLSGNINYAPTYNSSTSENLSRESAFERIQLKFGPAYKFRAQLRFSITASTEFGGKFITSNLTNAVPGLSHRRQAPARPPQLRVKNGSQPQNAVPGQPQAQLIDSYAEFLVPERDALDAWVTDSLPMTSAQLDNVMQRFVQTKPGDAPPISGTLAARVLVRWSQLEPGNEEINNYAKFVLEMNESDDARYFIQSDILDHLKDLAPNVETEAKETPYQAPSYLRSVPPLERVLGHSGVRAVTYRQYAEDFTPGRSSSIYDTIVDLVSELDPQALNHDVQHAGRTSKLKTIQGVSEGLESVLGRGREDAFIDEFMGNGGYTFQLINPTNWLLSSIIEINVKMQLKDDFRMLDVSTQSGMENYTHGYTGKSQTRGVGGGLSAAARLTTAFTKGEENFQVTVKGSANTGASRSLTTASVVVSEQTVYDWSGHVDFDVTHETIVTVRRVNMNDRPLNNLLLAATKSFKNFYNGNRNKLPRTDNRPMVPAVEERHQRLYGKVKLELPMSIAKGRAPAVQPAINSRPEFVGPLPGDATVSGNALDGLEPAAQRMLVEIQRKAWTIENLKNAVLMTDTTVFNPSASLKSLLSRTSLNGHLPAAIGGKVHRLAENLIVPGNPQNVITVDLFGELFRDGAEVLLETTGSGSGRYNKFASSTGHNLKVDNWRGTLGADVGLTTTKTPPPPKPSPAPTPPEGGRPSGGTPPIGSEKPESKFTAPRPDQIISGGADSGRSTSLGVTWSENQNSREEQHQKALVPDQAGGTDEKMYVVRFTGRFRLIASVRNRNLPGINAWPDPFRSNWVEGPVLVTLTKSQYLGMMGADYRPSRQFRREMNVRSTDPTPPNHRERDRRFQPSSFDPARPGNRGPRLLPHREGQEVPLRTDSPGRRPLYQSSFASSSPHLPPSTAGRETPVEPYPYQYEPFAYSSMTDLDEIPVYPPGQYQPPQYRPDRYPPSVPPGEPGFDLNRLLSKGYRVVPGQWGHRGPGNAPEVIPMRPTGPTVPLPAVPESHGHLSDLESSDEHDLATRERQQLKMLQLLSARNSQARVDTRSSQAAALPKYQQAGITRHFLDMPHEYDAANALLELINETVDSPELASLAETLELIGPDRMRLIFDGQSDWENDQHWDQEHFVRAVVAVRDELLKNGRSSAKQLVSKLFRAPPAHDSAPHQAQQTSTTTKPKSASQTKFDLLGPRLFMERMANDTGRDLGTLGRLVDNHYQTLHDHGVPEALHDRIDGRGLADQTLAGFLSDLAAAGQDERGRLAADLAQAIRQFDSAAFDGLDQEGIRSKIHDALRALRQDNASQAPPQGATPTPDPPRGEFDGRSFVDRMRSTRTTVDHAQLSTLVEVFYPALLGQDVPRALHERMDTASADRTLVELLVHLRDLGAHPEQGAENLAGGIGLMPNRAFRIGLPADVLRDAIHLVGNKQLHGGIFHIAARDNVIGVIRELIESERTYRQTRHVEIGKRQSERQPRGGSSRVRQTRAPEPTDNQRDRVLQAVAQDRNPPERRVAERRFEALVANGVANVLITMPDQDLANRVLTAMIGADTTFDARVFDEFRPGELAAFFGPNSRMNQYHIVRMLVELHDRRTFRHQSDEQIRAYIERKLRETRPR